MKSAHVIYNYYLYIPKDCEKSLFFVVFFPSQFIARNSAPLQRAQESISIFLIAFYYKHHKIHL